jgi:hypothetical protein
MTRQIYKTPEPLFVQASVRGMTPFTDMTHSERERDKRVRCSIYKQASLITINKPAPDNTRFPVTIKHGNVCVKLPMAMK